MKAKTLTATVVIGMAFLLALTGCSRKDTGEPSSPTGPSTFSVILKVNASVNVLMAAAERESVMITATLKKYDGTPLANRTIYFEIGDASHNKLTIGYFDGFEYVKSVTTDSSGTARITYYGPLASELAANASIYIWASVAMEENYSVMDFSQLDIIGDPSTLSFKVVADPDVLYATAYRPVSDVTATVLYGAKPIVNKRVYFSVLANYPGYFTGHKRTAYAETDSDGIAHIQYFGPTKDEISQDLGVVIRGQLETSTTIPPENMILEEIYIRIIRQ